MIVEIREIGPADYPALAAIVNAVTPDNPTSVGELAWGDATFPGSLRFLGDVDARTVGAATVGRIFMYPPEFDALWLSIEVLPEYRRRGLGTAFYGAASRVAHRAGKVALHTSTSETRPESIDFLVHRGFEEYVRHKLLALDLVGLQPPSADPPDGIAIVTLADRPDLVAGVHAAAVEAFVDIPTIGEPVSPGSLAEFRARDVDRPSIPAEGFAIALDEASQDVVGYASLVFVPGSTTHAYHDMTAVRRAWRGRGIALALKRTTIRWAIGAGLERLETGNDPDNAGMRKINAALGYRPLPDDITFRGPLAPRGAGS